MSVSRIASRYAKSLMDLSIERHILEEVLKDMQSFISCLDNRDLFLMLKSPIIHTDKKQEIFNLIFKGKLGELTTAFFSIILRKGREEFLPEIAEEFVKQYKDYKGITTVSLTTAAKLNQQTLQEIKNKLLASNITRDDIELILKVDSNLIGGFLLEVGDKLYDASVVHKLEEFRKSLLDNKYMASL